MRIKLYRSLKLSSGFLIVSFLLIIYNMNGSHNTKIQITQVNQPYEFQLNDVKTLLSAKRPISQPKEIVNENKVELMFKKTMKSNENQLLKVNPIILQRLFHKGAELHSNHSIRISQLGAFQIQTTLDERHMMYTLLEVFDGVMKKNNISYFMYGGTLLGSYRHHDFIPWDDDIDILVSWEHHDTILMVLSALSPEFIHYQVTIRDKFYHKSAKKTSKQNWLWPYLDIMYYEDNGSHIKDVSETCCHYTQTYGNWHYFPKEIVFPLHDRPLLYLSLPAPRDTFAFLTWTYNYSSRCEMKGYSHMVESTGPSGIVDCDNLSEKFPFVEHLPDVNGVREILKYKDLEIRNMVINEPRYAVAETFNLSLKAGFTMPKHLTPPP